MNKKGQVGEGIVVLMILLIVAVFVIVMMNRNAYAACENNGFNFRTDHKMHFFSDNQVECDYDNIISYRCYFENLDFDKWGNANVTKWICK